ncbi:MAG: hypothetical protein Tsb009_27950 [Planctomycetaceae bacterium]
MKSEHRRELHANELEKVTEQVGKFFETHGKKVLLGLVAGVVVGVAIYLGMQFRGKSNESITAQLLNANSAEEHLTIAEDPDYSGIPAKTVARLIGAEEQLDQAIKMYFTGRKAGYDDLKKARENFETVLNSDEIPNWAKERALFGLAVCTEAMSGPDTSEAIQAYETLLKEFPETDYKAMAEERIADLKTTRQQEFYAFLSSTDRKPDDLKLPADPLNNIKLPPSHPTINTPATIEKPVELPRIPSRLSTDLGDEQSGPAPFPFPPAPTKNGDSKPSTKSGPVLKAPTKTKPAEKTKPSAGKK